MSTGRREQYTPTLATPRRDSRGDWGWVLGLCAGLALALALAAGCGGGQERSAAQQQRVAGEVVMTRMAACYQVAMEICETQPGCRWRKVSGEYDCREWVVSECCKNEKSCKQEVTIRIADLNACYRQIESNYECNTLFTPACQRIIPGAVEPEQ